MNTCRCHRENTIAAFREAIRLGAHMIEFDVALTGDGKLVLMHDHTIDRTTDGSGRVEEWLLADLKKLDAGSWKNSRFEGERIPTLS
ncbi:MAG: glycerophosphodiester phosphodiesterase family protein, partial [Verrucomicrobiota bacterium]|nr:glycerophosphodiester phosphodiesterase family protein [Verrucomicrobiota bacterium]